MLLTHNLFWQGISPPKAIHGRLTQLFCFLGCMTANRRTRVRGHYGINGSIVDDCVLSFFFNQCVLMQLDREIRARHGNTKLRTHPDYKRVLDQQPRLTPGMTYVPMEGLGGVPNRSPGAQPPTGTKGLSKVSTRHQLQEVLNASGLDEVSLPHKMELYWSSPSWACITVS